MYIGKIDADVTVQAQHASEPAEPRGSFAVGLLFLAVAIPYWTVRFIGGMLWRDLSRAGRFVRLCGASYSDALKER